MPLVGSRNLSAFAESAPAIADLHVDRWEFPKSQILTVMYELDDDAML